ncbi:restriction endonuclease subunit S [Streptomyces sp. SYSU K21746]
MAVLFEGHEAAVCSNFCARVTPAPGVDSRFLTYVFSAAYGQGLTQSAIKQTTGIQNLDAAALLSSNWAYPSLEEQRRIADFLDTETTRIDRLVSARRSQMALFDERLDSIRDQFFGSSAAPAVSRPLMHLTNPYRPIVYGIVQAGPEVSGGVPYIKTGDLGNLRPELLSRTSPQIHAQFQRAAVHPGDIVMAMRASIGAVAAVPPELPEANLTQGTARIAPAQGVDGRWLLQALQTRQVREQCALRAVGSTFRTLNIWDLRRININSVPPEMQASTISRFDSYATTHARIRNGSQRQVELLTERRRAVIIAAVTGQFDVSSASGQGVVSP